MALRPLARLPVVLLDLSLVLALSLPLGVILARMAGGWQGVLIELSRPRLWALAANSLALVLAVWGFSLALALPLAYLLGRRSFLGRPLALGLITLPLATPGYVIAWGLLSAAGPQGWAPFLQTMPRASGLVWAALAISLYAFPLLALNLYQGFIELDNRPLEAALTLGKGRLERFLRLIFPLLAPSLGRGLAILGLYTLGDFAVPHLLQWEVLASAFYQDLVAGGAPGTGLSFAYLTLLGTVFVLAREPNTAPEFRWALAHQHSRPRRLSAILAWGALLLLLLPSLLIPSVALIHWLKALASQGGNPIPWFRLTQAVGGSLVSALVGSSLGLVFALGLDLLRSSMPRITASWPNAFVLFLHSLPGVILAFGWVTTFLNLLPALYQTAVAYGIALGISATAVVSGPLRASRQGISRLWVWAARSMGKGRLSIFWNVEWPALRDGALLGWLLAAGWLLRELPMTLLLAPLGTRTLSASVFGFTNEADYAGASPYAFVLFVLGLVPGLVTTLMRRHRDPTA